MWLRHYNQKNAQSGKVDLPGVKMILCNAGNGNAAFIKAVTSDTADASDVFKPVQDTLGLDFSVQREGRISSVRGDDELESVRNNVISPNGESMNALELERDPSYTCGSLRVEALRVNSRKI